MSRVFTVIGAQAPSTLGTFRYVRKLDTAHPGC